MQFNDLRTVQALDGSWIVLNKNGSISVNNGEGRELERYNVVIGSVISKEDGAAVKKGETFVQWIHSTFRFSPTKAEKLNSAT